MGDIGKFSNTKIDSKVYFLAEDCKNIISIILLPLFYIGETVTVVDGEIDSDHELVLPCGCQVTFTCNNTTPQRSVVLWNVQKLHGIKDDQTTSIVLSTNNLRISTKDSSVSTTFSRLTISGFTAADNGGIVTCYFLGKDRENKVHVKVGEYGQVARHVLLCTE